eukprot:TRINITY_DN109_c0_g1_i1.p2 TRINITY_DN109_c0_g1~~TRINITY_DN109_c0_g1_i1.p2  ORF type:complete len:218 (+),score=90.94 TRINITY_DN109_c0_g1_i1:66-719(+)
MQTGHILVGILSLVCVVFLAAALGDGRSVIIIKSTSSLRGASYPDGYGVGVFTDARGNDWRDTAHPTEVLGCTKHQRRGVAVASFSVIAIVASSAAVVVSLLGASEGGKFGMVNAGLQALMFLSFLMATALGWDVVEGKFYCHTLKADLKLKDHFIYNYGVFFLLAGTIVSLVNIGLLAATGSLSAQAKEEGAGAHEPTAEAEAEAVPEKKEDPAAN